MTEALTTRLRAAAVMALDGPDQTNPADIVAILDDRAALQEALAGVLELVGSYGLGLNKLRDLVLAALATSRKLDGGA